MGQDLAGQSQVPSPVQCKNSLQSEGSAYLLLGACVRKRCGGLLHGF